jgi:hypothetical protein
MGTTFMEGRLGNLDSQSEVYVPNYWWGANLRNLEIMFSVLRKKLLCLLIAGRSATTRTCIRLYAVDDDDDAAARARADNNKRSLSICTGATHRIRTSVLNSGST